MKKILFLSFFALTSFFYARSQSNPVAEFYPDGYPGWTDNIKWDNVINMKTDPQITAVDGEWARFEKGVELLGEAGGVLYYPAGTYVFSDLPAGENGAKIDGEGIMLRSGVVLMGEKPASRQLACDTEKGALELSTIFQFPQYDREVIVTDDNNPVKKKTPGHWNFVGIKPRTGETLKDVDNVGICFINFKYGGVYWGAEYVWGESYQDPNVNAYGAAGCEAKYGWMKDRVADGTHYADPFGGCLKRTVNGTDGTEYVGAGKGRLILGCRFDDAVLMDAGGYDGNYSDGYDAGASKNFKGLALDPYRFAGRITIDASNVFIASTSITKPTTAFLYKEWLQMASKDPINDRDNQKMMLQVPQLFDPAKQIGIDVGKSILGLVASGQRKMLDDNAPFYELNIIIRDCYVYNHGNKGYEASGRWVKVFNNVNDRDYLDGGSIPSVSGSGAVTVVGDAKTVYGLSDIIPYKIRKGSGTMDVAGAEGHYIARMSSLRGTNQTDDNMSRAFDMGGHNIWVDSNRYWGTGSWPGNDGEGILGQRSGEIEAFSWAITNNKALDKGKSKSGYMATYDMHTVGAMWYYNTGEPSEWNAGIWKPGANKIEEISVIGNTRNGTPADALEEGTGSNGPLWSTQNYPGGTILPPSNVQASYNAEGNYTEISWNPDYVIDGSTVTDNSMEIGYRVERRKQGTEEWSVVAYRPLQNGYKVLTGVNRTYKGQDSWTLEEMDLNPPVWRDYEKTYGKVEYRVVALGVTTEDDVPQTEAPAVVDFGQPLGIGNSVVNNAISVYPNPVVDILTLSQNVDIIEVLNLNGTVVAYATATNQINLQSLPSGFYVIKTKLNGATSMSKIIKK